MAKNRAWGAVMAMVRGVTGYVAAIAILLSAVLSILCVLLFVLYVLAKNQGLKPGAAGDLSEFAIGFFWGTITLLMLLLLLL